MKIRIRKVRLGWHVIIPAGELPPCPPSQVTLVCTSWIGALVFVMNLIENHDPRSRWWPQ